MDDHEWDPTRPRWEQVAEVLRARITDGTYPPGTLLSESRLQEEWGIARLTARKVTRALAAEGLMVVRPGWGSFVADRGQGQ